MVIICTVSRGPGCGKGVFASVARERGFDIYEMGDAIRLELLLRDVPLTGENVAGIVNELTSLDRLIVSKRTFDSIMRESGPDNIIIDGVRRVEEIDYFREKFDSDLYVVGIDADPEILINRLLGRGRSDSLTPDEVRQRIKQENEWGLQEAFNKADEIIMNNRTEKDFKEQVRRLLVRYETLVIN